MSELNKEQKEAVELLRKARLDVAKGLPEELFWLVSSWTPIVNVDLLIVNNSGQILLARRNDDFHPDCWHIPGGCIRFGETMLHRVHETAQKELGCDVIVRESPIAVRDAIRPPILNREYPDERRHFVSILYECRLPEGEVILNRNLTEEDPGYLKWFDRLPKGFVEIQHIYDDILTPWNKKEEEIRKNGF